MSGLSSPTVAQDFRIKFVTPDGSVVMDRMAPSDLYFIRPGVPDTELINLVLDKDAKEKGVRVLTIKIKTTGIQAVVDWL